MQYPAGAPTQHEISGTLKEGTDAGVLDKTEYDSARRVMPLERLRELLGTAAKFPLRQAARIKPWPASYSTGWGGYRRRRRRSSGIASASKWSIWTATGLAGCAFPLFSARARYNTPVKQARQPLADV